MPGRIPHGAAEAADPAPTVRAWFDALTRGDLRTLKSLTHPEFQFRGEGPPAFAPASGRKAVLDRARAVRKGAVGCPTLMGIERLPGGGLMVTWELTGDDGRAVERGLSFAHADSRHMRSVATHSVSLEEQRALAPRVPEAPPVGDPHLRHPEGWDTLRERIRVSGNGWLDESSRAPLQTVAWTNVRRWGWRAGIVLLSLEILYLLVRQLVA
jgi:hypothetical protein